MFAINLGFGTSGLRLYDTWRNRDKITVLIKKIDDKVRAARSVARSWLLDELQTQYLVNLLPSVGNLRSLFVDGDQRESLGNLSSYYLSCDNYHHHGDLELYWQLL